jgi:molybdate transport system substrate-binding protein
VTFNFLASSDLAAQIQQGAPADVFASADENNMSRVTDAGLVDGRPQVFARNRLAIVVPPGNPAAVTQLGDLADDDLIVSLCNDECPAGRYARRAFDKAGIDVEPDSLESEVRAVVTRVSLGEADAGVAYASDAVAARGDVDAVVIPRADNVLATYPIAVLDDAPEEARDFVTLVLSDPGQETMVEYGFLPR